MTALTAPVHPHEMSKAAREQLNDLVRRVSVRATIDGLGHDLMLRVYMAGFYHGVEALKARPLPPPSDIELHHAT